MSSVAIVVTLAYLAIQTQQNTRALQASARQASLDSELGVLYKAMEYPILYAGPEGGPGRLIELSAPGYTREDIIRIILWEVATIRARENYWLQYRDGALDAETWESYRSVLVQRIRGSERTRKVWELYANQFDPDFAAEVNSYVSD